MVTYTNGAADCQDSILKIPYLFPILHGTRCESKLPGRALKLSGVNQNYTAVYLNYPAVNQNYLAVYLNYPTVYLNYPT
jgi:hypothetical protein